MGLKLGQAMGHVVWGQVVSKRAEIHTHSHAHSSVHSRLVLPLSIPLVRLSFFPSLFLFLSLSLSLLSFSLPLAPLSPADSDCPSLFPFQTQSAIPCPVTTSYDQFPHRLYLYQQLRLASTSAQLTRIHKSGHAPFHHHNRHNRHNHRAGTSGVQPGIHNDR